MMRLPQLTLITCLLCLASGLSAQEPALEITFETGSLSDDWSAIKAISAARVSAPDVPANVQDGPAGKALAIKSAGNAGVFLKVGKGPSDWSQCSEISFWAYRSPEEAAKNATSTLEVQIYEKQPGARFWRKITLDHTGWKEINVPLKWCRWASGRIPRWSNADRMGIWLRDEANIVIDSLEVTKGAGERPAELTVSDLRSLAFPNAADDEVTIIEGKEVVLLSNAPKLNAKQLDEHLSKVAAMVRQDLGLPRPVIKPVLIIFETETEYRDFPPRLGDKLNSIAERPGSGGYALHGVASAAWNEQFGTLRPVYTHEFVHSLLARSSGIPNKREWFQEGVANYYQIRFHPQQNLKQIVLAGIKDSSQQSKLNELCSGRPISTSRYWQALTVIDFLRRDPAYAERFPEMIAEMGQKGSTDLGPYLETYWKTNWQDFNDQWTAHCLKAFGK